MNDNSPHIGKLRLPVERCLMNDDHTPTGIPPESLKPGDRVVVDGIGALEVIDTRDPATVLLRIPGTNSTLRCGWRRLRWPVGDHAVK